MKLDPNIFRAYDIRGTVGENITPEVVRTITHGFGSVLASGSGATVVLGRDLRTSSEELSGAAAEGLREAGCDVLDIGQVPVPLVYFAAGRWACAGGVGITASHKPPQFNGLKLRLGDRPYYGDQLQELRERCEAGRFNQGAGSYTQRDIFEEYFEVVRSKFDGSAGLSICLDLGNGAGTFTAPKLLEAAGAKLDIMFAEPDGTFPNRPADPLENGALSKLSARVVEIGADVGMAIDADGDRLAVVDDRGTLIYPDRYVIPICGSILKRHGRATFVSEVRCSQTTIDYVHERGGKVLLAACGYPFILAEMSRVAAPLGFETTGHVFFADPDVKFDDASFCAANVARALGHLAQPLREILAQAPKYYTSEELRLDCPDEIKNQVVAEVIERLRGKHEMITVDGARVLYDGGWGLIRASNTGEELVMRFEGRTEAQRDQIADEVQQAVHEVMAAHGV